MVLKSKPMVLAFKAWTLFVLTAFLAICLVKLFGPAPVTPKYTADQVAHDVTF